MHIFVEIRYMDHGLNIEKNETIKILRPASYWQELTIHQGNTVDYLVLEGSVIRANLQTI